MREVSAIAPDRGSLLAYEGLDDLFSFSSMFELGLTVVLLILLFWVSNLAIRFFWSLGFDRKHQLASLRTGVRIAAIVWIGLWIVSRAISSLPILSVIFLALAFAGAIYASIEPLQSAVASLAFLLKRRIRRGDMITVGSLTGVVERVDLLHLALRRNDGSVAWVPNREVNKGGVVVNARWNKIPLFVQLSSTDFNFSGRTIEQLREMAYLSPYRAPNTEVTMETDTEGLRIKFFIWSNDCEHAAGEHLKRIATKYLQPRKTE